MDIRKKVVEILSAHSNMNNIYQYFDENDDLTILGMNSIEFIKMVIDLEKEFKFTFNDEDLEHSNFISLSSLCNYVEKHMKLYNVTYSPNESE